MNITIEGKVINTSNKTISEVLKEAVSDVEMNDLEARKLYRFIHNEFENKNSCQSG